MDMPRRIPKARKRTGRWRSIAHCNYVRGHECSVPGCVARPIEVAHVRRGSDGGIGRKPSDWNVLSLCRDHHSEQHRIGEESFEQRYGIDLRRVADTFAIASPRAMQIKEAKANV